MTQVRRPSIRVLALGVLALGVLLTAAPPIQAHKPSDSYLTLHLDGEAIEGRWDIALRDLEYALGLDTDLDGAISWGELKGRRDDITAFALARLEARREGELCAALARDFLVEHHSDGAYSVLRFDLECPAAQGELRLDYGLFFDLDPTHRGLLRVEDRRAQKDRVGATAIFSPGAPSVTVGTGSPGSGRLLSTYWREGVWHIWIGFDHILFLIALLLPAVLRREGGGWAPAGSFRQALWPVVGVVSAFTVAHSITLALAVLDLVRLPSRWIEVTIAATVVIAALNNLVPILGDKVWRAAFVLGLIHGFGFANVLRDLGLPGGALTRALVGFNLGVESGQLAIVALFLPLAFLLRRTRFYRWGLLGAGSSAVALVALVWLIERGLDLRLL